MLVVDYRQGRPRASGYVGVGTEWVRLQSWWGEVALAACFANRKGQQVPFDRLRAGSHRAFSHVRHDKTLRIGMGEADSGTGKDSEPSGLIFSGFTKQFCPLLRKCLSSKPERRESSPVTMLAGSGRRLLTEKNEPATLKCGACEAREHRKTPGRKVAPTTTFVLFQALARLE
jgi:hypothetical protein